MNRNHDLGKKFIVFLVCYFIFCMMFFVSVKEEAFYSFSETQVANGTDVTQELVDGAVIENSVNIEGSYLKNIGILVGTYGRKNHGHLVMSLLKNDDIVASRKINIAKVGDNSVVELRVNKKITPGEFTLKIESVGAAEGEALSVYYDKSAGAQCAIGNKPVSGCLDMYLLEGVDNSFGKAVYCCLICLSVLFLIAVFVSYRRMCTGKTDAINSFYSQINKYFFLMKQLVKRDYKAKYMRSVLGLVWSLLYPVLMMAVQYVVFSTLFRTNIRYYPVYLLCANAMFSFFSNAVSSGLTSIVNNASLITKVYVPKYLYPVTKILSTSIDLFLSIIPLTIVVLLTGAPITKAWLLIPLLFVLLMVFSSGMAFLLSTINVFFRDTQFLWGLATTVWMYATPLFYPETAIPERFRMLLRLNPMYHYISCFRRVLMYGYAPTLQELGACLLFSVCVYFAGIVVFKKNEGKFILYI